MVETKIKIVWTQRAQEHMQEIFDFISADSVKNAVKVLDDITKSLDATLLNPEIYNADKYKHNNDGSYRSFEKHRYRVTYRYNKNTVRVLRVRHTSMEPKSY